MMRVLCTIALIAVVSAATLSEEEKRQLDALLAKAKSDNTNGRSL